MPAPVGVANDHDLQISGFGGLEDVGKLAEHPAGRRRQIGFAAVEQHVGVELADAALGIVVQARVALGQVGEPSAEPRRNRVGGNLSAPPVAVVQFVVLVLVVGQLLLLAMVAIVELGQIFLGANQLIFDIAGMELEILDFDLLARARSASVRFCVCRLS